MSSGARSLVVIGLAAACLSVMLASAAAAVPTYSFLYSGTTGTGTTGSGTIASSPGDVLTLDVLIHVDGDGISGWDFGLHGTGVTGISGEECPAGSSGGSNENLIAGACFTSNFGLIQPSIPGVVVSGSDILNFDGVTTTPYNGAPIVLFVARAVFQVDGVGIITLDGLGVSDGSFQVHPLLMVPEPATSGLMALGLAALGRLRRRPRGPSRGR